MLGSRSRILHGRHERYCLRESETKPSHQIPLIYKKLSEPFRFSLSYSSFSFLCNFLSISATFKLFRTLSAVSFRLGIKFLYYTNSTPYRVCWIVKSKIFVSDTLMQVFLCSSRHCPQCRSSCSLGKIHLGNLAGAFWKKWHHYRYCFYAMIYRRPILSILNHL